MPGIKIQANRTTGSGPPPNLLFGEIAYSDADQQLYIGRPGPQPPAIFHGDGSSINEAIEGLAADIVTLDSSQATQDLSIAAIEADQTAQNAAIATLTTGLATLDSSQAAQDTAIDALFIASSTQAAALGNKADATALATVATSGAYADLSGKPNLFSGAYADLSGKPNLFSGAYADLSGKPNLFSGAYADLSGRPTIPAGFTYDQQAEPVGAAAGQTWRERRSSGLIAGEWEWSGSLWLSNERYAPLYSGVSASANTSAVMSVYPKYPALLTAYSVSLNQPFASQDATNYWIFRHGGLAQGDWLTTIGVSTTATSFLQRILTTPIVITDPSQSDNFASRVGSPGNLRQFQAITHYKLIRS